MWAISTECKQTLFLDNVSLSSQRMVPELLYTKLTNVLTKIFERFGPNFWQNETFLHDVRPLYHQCETALESLWKFFNLLERKREVFRCSNHRALIEVTDLESICRQAVLST